MVGGPLSSSGRAISAQCDAVEAQDTPSNDLPTYETERTKSRPGTCDNDAYHLPPPAARSMACRLLSTASTAPRKRVVRGCLGFEGREGESKMTQKDADAR